MVLGNATQKIQTLVELAEELYEKVMEIRQQLVTLKETADDTNDRVTRLEQQVAEQRAIIGALAEQEDIDVEATIADVEIETATATEDTVTDEGDTATGP
ncbi:MAG: DUF5798 family protein [Halobacteriales archaeon]